MPRTYFSWSQRSVEVCSSFPEDNLIDALPVVESTLSPLLQRLLLLSESPSAHPAGRLSNIALTKPELLFHTQFLWSHRAVLLVTPLDFTFLLPHGFKSPPNCRKPECFSFAASVLRGIRCRSSYSGGNVWESSCCFLILSHYDFCLWKMTFRKKKESLPLRRFLLQP